MTEYRVDLVRSVTVEAESERQAKEQATANHPKMQIGADTLIAEEQEQHE